MKKDKQYTGTSTWTESKKINLKIKLYEVRTLLVRLYFIALIPLVAVVFGLDMAALAFTIPMWGLIAWTVIDGDI